MSQKYTKIIWNLWINYKGVSVGPLHLLSSIFLYFQSIKFECCLAAKTGAEIGPRVGMQLHSLQGLGVGVLQGPAFVPLILHVTEVQIPFEGPEKGWSYSTCHESWSEKTSLKPEISRVKNIYIADQKTCLKVKSLLTTWFWESMISLVKPRICMMFADLCWITVCISLQDMQSTCCLLCQGSSPDIPEKMCVCVIMYSTALVDMLQRNGHESFVCPSIRMH